MGKANLYRNAEVLSKAIAQSNDDVSNFLKGSNRKAFKYLRTFRFMPDKWSQIFMGKEGVYRGPGEGPNHYTDIDVVTDI